MFRLVLIFSLIPIAIALAARWWFGTRILSSLGNRPCRCDLTHWMPAPGDEALVHRAEESAADFGRQLRLKALTEWSRKEPKAAESRDNVRRFGLAVPPLSGVVAVFAVFVGKIPVVGAIAVFIGATALATIFGVLTLPQELGAITRAAQQARKSKSFPLHDDETAVIRCAMAHAWEAALPPVLRIFSR